MAEKRVGTKRRSASEWQALVSKLAESGEDVTQFCRRQGIYMPTLAESQQVTQARRHLEQARQLMPRDALILALAQRVEATLPPATSALARDAHPGRK
jgi:predicted nucleic acid-binding protein